MNDSYTCPTCKRSVYPHTQICPGCQMDLTAVAKLSEAADVCFNRALAAAAQGELPEAILQAGAGLSLRMSDAPLWILLGKMLARLGDWNDAVMCFHMARADPRANGLLMACADGAHAALQASASGAGQPADAPAPASAGKASPEIDQMLASLGVQPGSS